MKKTPLEEVLRHVPRDANGQMFIVTPDDVCAKFIDMVCDNVLKFELQRIVLIFQEGISSRSAKKMTAKIGSLIKKQGGEQNMHIVARAGISTSLIGELVKEFDDVGKLRVFETEPEEQSEVSE